MRETMIENGIEYIKCGDYYLPNLTVPSEHYQIGIFGKRHERYIKEHHKSYYTALFMTGKLFEYLAEVDKQAQAEYDLLISALAKKRVEEKGNHTFKQKICVMCGKSFWPSNGQEVLCSKECKAKNRREKQLAYYHENKDKWQKRSIAI